MTTVALKSSGFKKKKVIGVGNHDEVFNRDEKIIWTIPKRFIEFYKKEIENKKNRLITIQKTGIFHKKQISYMNHSS